MTWGKVSITKGSSDLLVPHNLPDRPYIRPIHGEFGAKVVAEVVEPKVLDSCALQGRFEYQIDEVLRIEGRSNLRGKDIFASQSGRQ